MGCLHGMNHYTYLTTDGERYYIGVRSCEGNPWKDNYWGTPKTEKGFEKRVTHKLILTYHDTQQEAKEAEEYFHAHFNVKDDPRFANHANAKANSFAEIGTEPWNKNVPRTEETKAKISASKTGKPLSNKQKAGLSKRFSGKGNNQYGKFGENHPAYGHTKTEECRRRIGEAARIRQTGKKASAETKKKMSKQKQGKNNPNVNKREYLFVHVTHGEVICTCLELREKFGLSKQNVSNIVNGWQKTSKGWTCHCLIKKPSGEA